MAELDGDGEYADGDDESEDADDLGEQVGVSDDGHGVSPFGIVQSKIVGALLRQWGENQISREV